MEYELQYLQARQHRVLAVFLSLECWTKGWDWITVKRGHLSVYLDLVQYRESRMSSLSVDVKPWFPITQQMIEPPSPKFDSMVFSRSKEWEKAFSQRPNYLDLKAARLTEAYVRTIIGFLGSGLRVPDSLDEYVKQGKTSSPSVQFPVGSSPAIAERVGTELRELRDSGVLEIRSANDDLERHAGAFYLPRLMAIFRAIELLRSELQRGVDRLQVEAELEKRLPTLDNQSKRILMQLAMGTSLEDDFPVKMMVSAQLLKTDEIEITVKIPRLDLKRSSLVFHQNCLWIVSNYTESKMVLSRVG